MKHIIISLRPHPGHAGEWLCYNPVSLLRGDERPELKEANGFEDIFKILPATSPNGRLASMAYMIALEPTHPLAVPHAVDFWPKNPTEVSPLIRDTTGSRMLETYYQTPEPCFWFGIEFEFIGSLSLPLYALDTRVKTFVSRVQQSIEATNRALEKAVHQ